MINKLKPKSDFGKHVLTLVSGTTLSQAIPILISPILTRLYTPQEFGILALYMSILMILSIFATGRYEFALPMTNETKDSNNIFVGILFILCLVSLIMLIVLFLFSEYIQIFVSNDIYELLYIMPINIILLGIFNAVQYWLNRSENFKKIALNKVTLNILIGSFQIAFGFNGLSEKGLILGYIFGYLTLLIYLTVTSKRFILNILPTISYNCIIHNLIKFKDFPFINSFHALSDKLQSDGVIFLISYKFGFSILGFYSMSLRAVTTPSGLVGDAIGQVVFSKFSKIYNETKNIQNEVKTILKKLFIFSTPFFIILFFLLPSLFSFIFGEEWIIAGEYAQVLLPYIYLNFIVSPVARIPLIVGQVKKYFTFSLTWNIVSISLFAISAFIYESFFISLCMFSFVRFLYTLYLLKWILNILKPKDN